MMFGKLSKEKRNHLILVTVGALAAAVGLWFGLIKHQYQNLEDLAQQKIKAQQKLQQVRDTVKHADRLEQELAAAADALDDAEADIATGDHYAWVVNLLRKFKAGYGVDIPQFGQLEGPRDVALLPAFPYKQVTLTVSGTGHFHDLGRFLADFENQFPHIRVVNLTLDLATTAGPENQDMLNFKMEIVTLAKVNPS